MMDLSAMFEKLYASLYQEKIYTKATLIGFVELGTLNKENYKRITGDDYQNGQ